MEFKIDPAFVVKATARIQQRKQQEQDLKTCLEGRVCPKCGSDLQKILGMPYVCKSCDLQWDL